MNKDDLIGHQLGGPKYKQLKAQVLLESAAGKSITELATSSGLSVRTISNMRRHLLPEIGLTSLKDPLMGAKLRVWVSLAMKSDLPDKDTPKGFYVYTLVPNKV